MKKFLELTVAHIHKDWAYILIGCFTVLICNVWVVSFVGQEQYVYFWDYANYWDKYSAISELFMANPLAGLKSLISSVRYANYNVLPVFPLIPFNVIFGSSRLSYILVLTNVYGIVAIFSMVVVLRTVERWQEGQDRLVAVSFIGVTTAALLPQFWSPILLGYPDVVGIIVINLVLYIHFRRPIEEQSGWSWATLGLSLCCLVLLRRWYAYWVVSYFLVFGLQRLVVSLQGAPFSMKRSWDSLKPVFVVGMAASLSMLLFAAPVARMMVVTNYADIYSAYKDSASFLDVLTILYSTLGAVVVLLFVVSATSLMLNREMRGKAIFLLVLCAAAVGLFWRTADFNSQHYYLLIPTLVLFISLWAARSYLSLKTRLARALFLSGYLLVMLANFSAVFVPQVGDRLGSSAALFSQERRHPLIRNDVAELRRMLNLVEQLADGGNEAVYVLASSVVLNDDILRHAGEGRGRPCVTCERIMVSGHVDKRDGLRKTFWDSKWVIVADPVQYHLKPEDQRVIGIPAHAILNQQGIGASYRKLAYEFALDNGVKAYIYEKVRPFERKAVDSVEAEFLKHYPRWEKFSGTVFGG